MQKIDSYKMLIVMDHTRCYIFVHICLGNNAREVFTSSSLYLHEGDFFLRTRRSHVMVILKWTESSCAHISTQEMIIIK